MDRYVPLPPLPDRIRRLNELASDLWWSWNAEAREVFRDLDLPLWRFTDHNPVLLLHLVEPERLEHAAADPGFLKLYDAAAAALDMAHAGSGTWWARRSAPGLGPIACVCPEFALHQSLPLDADASGVLAGDLAKQASDLGVPLVGVGLMYPRGYPHQRLTAEGWQQESYEYLDWSDTPIGPALCADGRRCDIVIALAGGDVHVDVWQVRAGRVTVYLLDSDRPENAPWDRDLSSRPCGDDQDARVRQEVLLGAGAVRALDALGIEPSLWHLHGRCAFVAFERLAQRLRQGAAWDTALAQVRGTSVYDMRTPAPPPADHVAFGSIERQVAACWPALAGWRAELMSLGRTETDRGSFFDSGTLGVSASALVNAPPVEDGRAGSDADARVTIAPGVHVPSWVSADIARLFELYVGPDWRARQDDAARWEPLRDVPDEEMWAVRQRLRRYLLDFARERARRRWSREQASGPRLVALGTLLDPTTLTLGFAHRFTGVRAPELLFEDPQRLAAILTAARRPVQILFAGRARPADEAGKHRLQRVIRRALDPMFGGRIAFLEDYDLHVARLMVQGCDVWLSTPRRDGLASISGLKAGINGVPQLATPAGWWPGGFTGANGWTIDAGGGDAASQETADARALYRLLEDEVVPAFYERDRAGVPPRWTQLIKSTIVATVPRFCARHAVKTMAERLYLAPASNQ